MEDIHMKKKAPFFVILTLALMIAGCTTSNVENGNAASQGKSIPAVETTIIEIEKYGHAVFDETIEDFLAKGYELGDTVDIVFSSGYVLEDIPFYNGYYVGNGEPMLRAYPGHTNIAACINYGKMNEIADVAVGDTAIVSLSGKSAKLDEQTLNSLVYTDDRSDYGSDEIFANFREIRFGGIAPGRLYRSASPVNNEHGRAKYADAFAKCAGINAILNLADTPQEVEEHISSDGFSSDYYATLCNEGRVIALGMNVDFVSKDFGDRLATGLGQLSRLDPPYLVHCTEGKDRAGFTSALLSLLMGANIDETIADYMTSYENYYGLTTADEAKYALIADNNIIPMLRAIAGIDESTDVRSVDFEKAASDYLLKHGMKAEELMMLKTKLGE